MSYKNPVFNTESFKNNTTQVNTLSQNSYNNYVLNQYAGRGTRLDTMTLDGTIGKTFVLLSIVLASGTFAWKFLATMDSTQQMIWIAGASILAFIVAIAQCFCLKQSAILAPTYALLEGFAIGGISMAYGMLYEGIVLHAVGLTVLVLVAMLLIYTCGWVKLSNRFKLGLFVSVLAVMGLYMLEITAQIFYGISIPLLHSTGLVGIGFGLFIVGLAAFYLIADFEMIESCVTQKQPKYMEWYCAYGMMVTIIWLYLEILRLLSKK